MLTELTAVLSLYGTLVIILVSVKLSCSILLRLPSRMYGMVLSLHHSVLRTKRVTIYICCALPNRLLFMMSQPADIVSTGRGGVGQLETQQVKRCPSICGHISLGLLYQVPCHIIDCLTYTITTGSLVVVIA